MKEGRIQPGKGTKRTAHQECAVPFHGFSRQMAQQAASLKRLNGAGRNANRRGRVKKGIRGVRERLGRSADEVAAEEVERWKKEGLKRRAGGEAEGEGKVGQGVGEGAGPMSQQEEGAHLASLQPQVAPWVSSRWPC